MNKHTESIVVFGMVLPAFLLAGVLGGIIFARGKLHAAQAEKVAAYREHEQVVAALQKTEADFGTRSENLDYWKESLSKELVQTLTANLREAMVDYTDDQLRQTELGRPSNSSQFAAGTENSYERLSLSFEGGFAPMQRVMAELELKMPQLALESLMVGPTSSGPSNQGSQRRLKFVATYLSWQDGDIAN